MFEDIEGVKIVVDDLLICVETEECRLEEVLQRAEQRNLRTMQGNQPHYRRGRIETRPKEKLRP